MYNIRSHCRQRRNLNTGHVILMGVEVSLAGKNINTRVADILLRKLFEPE
jgi:hypothetical protein